MSEIVLEIIREEVVVVETGQQGLPGKTSTYRLITERLPIVDWVATLGHAPMGGLVWDSAVLFFADGSSVTVIGLLLAENSAQVFEVSLTENDKQWLINSELLPTEMVVSYLVRE